MTASPSGTVLTGVGALIIDASGNVWAINSGSQVTVNGAVDLTTRNVDELAYDNGVVWQKNADNHWYSKVAPASGWVAWTEASPPIAIPQVSPDDATILAGGSANLVDANGNVWGLAQATPGNAYQITVDGTVDATTKNVAQMDVVHDIIWQENTAGLWYSKTTPNSAWSPGTSIDPITGVAEPVTLSWVGGGNNLASNPADWSADVAPGPGEALTMTSGTMNLIGDALSGDVLSVPARGTVHIATDGQATLNLSAGPGAVVNIDIASGASLTLNAHMTSSYLNASGGTIAFIGDNAFSGFSTVLSDNLVGDATLGLTGGNANGEFMEINGSVGSGLTFVINAASAPDATLQIDHPDTFEGLIDLTAAPVGLGHVAFMGIHATCASLHDGILQMFDGNSIVDTTRLTGGNALQLHQTAAGVVLTAGSYSDIPPADLGTVIPLRT